MIGFALDIEYLDDNAIGMIREHINTYLWGISLELL
jgi:hypothetical protein